MSGFNKSHLMPRNPAADEEEAQRAVAQARQTNTEMQMQALLDNPLMGELLKIIQRDITAEPPPQPKVPFWKKAVTFNVADPSVRAELQAAETAKDPASRLYAQRQSQLPEVMDTFEKIRSQNVQLLDRQRIGEQEQDRLSTEWEHEQLRMDRQDTLTRNTGIFTEALENGVNPFDQSGNIRDYTDIANELADRHNRRLAAEQNTQAILDRAAKARAHRDEQDAIKVENQLNGRLTAAEYMDNLDEITGNLLQVYQFAMLELETDEEREKFAGTLYDLSKSIYHGVLKSVYGIDISDKNPLYGGYDIIPKNAPLAGANKDVPVVDTPVVDTPPETPPEKAKALPEADLGQQGGPPSAEELAAAGLNPDDPMAPIVYAAMKEVERRKSGGQ